MKRDSLTRRVRGLADDTSRSPVAHVGLAYEKLAPHRSALDPDAKSRFVRQLADFSEMPEGYSTLFNRWVRRTLDDHNGLFGRRTRIAVSQGRVLCGLGLLTPSENGLAIHATYGVPYLPGSSLKGIARAWLVEQVTTGPWATGGALFREIFGWQAGGEEDREQDPGLSGAVSFLDALWTPPDEHLTQLPKHPWAAEIVTPHHGKYFAGHGGPDGTESPVPSTFLAAQGGFRVVIEGPQEMLGPTMDVLERALAERGVGAKGRAGYGRFVFLDEMTGVERDIEEQRQAAARRETAESRVTEAKDVVEALEELALLVGKDGLAAELQAWLTGDSPHRLISHFPVTPEAAANAWTWAKGRHLKILRRRIKKRVAPEIMAAIDKVSEALDLRKKSRRRKT
ncbi:MAG: type III-B CRISPR module RAMP protein Cmr6 [Myxococcota bacterium]